MVCPPCCSKFMVFVVFGVLFVPIMVFLLGAFFAAILLAIECAEAKAAPELMDVDLMCSYYDWWKYILGNLVGVSGLTNVGPASGHVFAEVVDLLVAVSPEASSVQTVSLYGMSCPSSLGPPTGCSKP